MFEGPGTMAESTEASADLVTLCYAVSLKVVFENMIINFINVDV